ncbi:MAG: hypothetical protein MUC34_16800 [Anaerolineae bacterium]|nr:hypothetical protein [Anaerolineae bacterium]
MSVSGLERVTAATFLRLWSFGYTSPNKLVDALAGWPAPHTGFFAQLLRGLLDSLIVYLPPALMRRVPPTPPYLSFIPADRYYAALILLGPMVLLLELLMSAAIIHIVLRLARRASDFDALINLTGMAALVVGAVLIPWDWFWFARGGVNQIFLGISHLVISVWAWVIMFAGTRRRFAAPVWLALLANALALFGSMPLAIMFMRSPV